MNGDKQSYMIEASLYWIKQKTNHSTSTLADEQVE